MYTLVCICTKLEKVALTLFFPYLVAAFLDAVLQIYASALTVSTTSILYFQL